MDNFDSFSLVDIIAVCKHIKIYLLILLLVGIGYFPILRYHSGDVSNLEHALCTCLRDISVGGTKGLYIFNFGRYS